MSKSNYRVFQILSEMFNFKMAIRRTKIWGKLKPESGWSGVVGLINRSEIDIAISGLRWEMDRYGAFDQTTNSFYVQLVYLSDFIKFPSAKRTVSLQSTESCSYFAIRKL